VSARDKFTGEALCLSLGAPHDDRKIEKYRHDNAKLDITFNSRFDAVQRHRHRKLLALLPTYFRRSRTRTGMLTGEASAPSEARPSL